MYLAQYNHPFCHLLQPILFHTYQQLRPSPFNEQEVYSPQYVRSPLRKPLPTVRHATNELTVDYRAREAGELCISKNDIIVFMDIDDGWCRGRNLTRGGQEGIFPKRTSLIRLLLHLTTKV